MPPRHRLLPAAVLTLAAAATAACGSRTPAVVAPSPAAGSTVVDLVTRTGGYPAGQRAITQAEDRLVARCMTAAGLRYVISPEAPAPTDYGLYAQHTGQRTDPSSDRATNDYYLARLPAGERAAYLKVLRSPEQAAMRLSDGRQITYSTHGCEPDARARLYGDLQTQVKVFYVPQIVDTAVEKRIRQDPRHLAAMTTWRQCMTAGGAPYASSGDARAQLDALYAKTGPTARTHQREIAVATLDHGCTAQARLTETDAELVRAALTALPKPDRQELDKLATTWQRTVDVARSTP